MSNHNVDALCRLLEFYSEQGRTLDSITHLCGRKRKTLIKYARQKGLKFPDLRAQPRVIVEAGSE
jgi:hypothetical protein